MNIFEAMTELEKFSPKISTLGPPLQETIVNTFENKFKIQLPEDYKIFLSKHNGASLLGTEIYGIEVHNNNYSLQDCYMFEHFKASNKMPLYLVPFSPDGRGNYYCFDTSVNAEGFNPIVFWQHDYNYVSDDLPEITNKSFAHWIQTVMIDWTLEDYHYDGSEK